MGASRVTYFEIPATELDRAAAFYCALFGITLERAQIDHLEMAIFPNPDGVPGIAGALVTGESYCPLLAGSRVYFSCTDIDRTLARVVRLGGRTLYPKTSIGELGWVAEFEDSEGNRVALHCARADDERDR